MFSLVYHKSEGFIQKDIEATNGDNILKRVCLCLFFFGVGMQSLSKWKHILSFHVSHMKSIVLVRKIWHQI